MTRRDWWLGILVVGGVILLHALVPRYEWRTVEGVTLRTDRWSGTSVAGRYDERSGDWHTMAQMPGTASATDIKSIDSTPAK